ncbi:MAG: thioredoxin family protein [Gammaproteobacteria bacterium]|nr:thioredoxin family protein [Gammaproteobacteria bacterium]
MVRLQSRMVELGTAAPPFALPDPTGRVHALPDFAASPGLLVAFICNHCPYVKHILDGFAGFAREYGPRGLAIVAISANDVRAYPEDAPPAMAEIAARHKFTFPYLYDESQAVAHAYHAVCTPEFFLFDQSRRLVYGGQFDDSRPNSGIPVTGVSLRAAADAVLAGSPIPVEQRSSVGCSIKWKAGNAPVA